MSRKTCWLICSAVWTVAHFIPPVSAVPTTAGMLIGAAGALWTHYHFEGEKP